MSPGQVVYALGPISMDDRIPVGRDLFPSPLSTPLPATPLSQAFPNVCPSSTTRMKPSHLPHPPPHSLPPVPPPLPISSDVLISKPFKTIKRPLRSKTTRTNPYKMDYLRLRSEVKWRLKDLGFETRLAHPPSPVGLARSGDAVQMLVKIGSTPVLFRPASIFDTPLPVPVVPTPRRNDLDDNIRISVLASLDFPKRAYRPRRRRRLVPAESELIEDVEFS